MFAVTIKANEVPAQFIVNTSKSNVSCFGGKNGTASASPYGGVSPYTYLWSNGRTTKTITGLAAGTYIVTVTAANAATATGSAVITQPANPLTISSFTQACNSLTLNPAGGTPPYSVAEWYHYTPPYLYLNEPLNQQGSFTATGLVSGEKYYAWLQDIKGCVAVIGEYTLAGCRQAFSLIDSNFLLSPNPATLSTVVSFNFKGSGGSKGNLELYDLTGRKIRRIDFIVDLGENVKKFDLSGINTGAYIVKLSVDEGITMAQFIIVNTN